MELFHRSLVEHLEASLPRDTGATLTVQQIPGSVPTLRLRLTFPRAARHELELRQTLATLRVLAHPAPRPLAIRDLLDQPPEAVAHWLLGYLPCRRTVARDPRPGAVVPRFGALTHTGGALVVQVTGTTSVDCATGLELFEVADGRWRGTTPPTAVADGRWRGTTPPTAPLDLARAQAAAQAEIAWRGVFVRGNRLCLGAPADFARTELAPDALRHFVPRATAPTWLRALPAAVGLDRAERRRVADRAG